MARIRRIALPEPVYIDALASSGSHRELVRSMGEIVGVEDLKHETSAPSGADVHVYVSSATFRDIGCCYMTKAPLWPEATEKLQGIAGVRASTRPAAGTGTSDPAPQGGTE